MPSQSKCKEKEEVVKTMLTSQIDQMANSNFFVYFFQISRPFHNHLKTGIKRDFLSLRYRFIQENGIKRIIFKSKQNTSNTYYMFNKTLVENYFLKMSNKLGYLTKFARHRFSEFSNCSIICCIANKKCGTNDHSYIDPLV